MAEQPAAPGTWDEDPSGVSILLATGRARHDLLVIADPAMLGVLDSAWGRPSARVRLSFLPGVCAPVGPGQEDALVSYERDGLSVLVARGRTSPIEGKPARTTTALARIVGAAGVRAALLVARASSLGAAAPGDLLAIGDHINLSCAPLFPADEIVSAAWDEALTARLARMRGVRGMGVVALTPGPMRPTPAEARVLAGMGADAAVTDTVAEGMTLAAAGVPTAALAVIDEVLAEPAAQPSGRRAAPASTSRLQRPAATVVLDAIETVLGGLRA